MCIRARGMPVFCFRTSSSAGLARGRSESRDMGLLARAGFERADTARTRLLVIGKEVISGYVERFCKTDDCFP